LLLHSLSRLLFGVWLLLNDIILIYCFIDHAYHCRPVGGCPRLGHLSYGIKLQFWQYNAFGGVDKQKESYEDLNKYDFFPLEGTWKIPSRKKCSYCCF